MTRLGKKVLLLYKDSAYQTHLRGAKGHFPNLSRCSGVLARLKKAHERHLRTLDEIEKIMTARKVRYCKKRRGRKVDTTGFDRIITVGGDGTFLEAALQAKDQPVLGVNSDPLRSVGRFCAADVKSFARYLEVLMDGSRQISLVNRLRFSNRRNGIKKDFLNDLLCCHRNPSFMSHYQLRIGRQAEEQRSSGLWVATAAGSTGAVHSAGGRILPLRSARFQYRPRELYIGQKNKYKLTGATLSSTAIVKITSYMTEGYCCIDGANIVVPFPFGEEVSISRSPQPLRVVGL